MVYQMKLNELIFAMPERWLHIREMARKLGVSPNTVRKDIAILKKSGIVEERKEGNMIMIRAKLDNENYKREKRIHNLHSIYKSGIVDYLFDFYDTPSAIILFGSHSRGEDISTSDIDICILTKNKKRPDLSGFEKKVFRRIELSLLTRKEVSDEFFNNLINGIVLKGVLTI